MAVISLRLQASSLGQRRSFNADVAVFAANYAKIAYFPPNCTAELRERGAESTFCVGGKLG